MTEASAAAPLVDPTFIKRVARLAKNLPQRLHEREFWIIQAGVIGVTVAHILAELWAEETGLHIPTAFHHIPVILYLGPISYASLSYGSEGAVLTGLWSGALTVPNLLIWHRTNFEWLEGVYVVVVIVTGIIMSVPVERERQQRRRAEATSQRLALLDHIATLTLTADLASTLDQTLNRLLDVLRLEAACVALADPAKPGGADVLSCHPGGGLAAEALSEYIHGQRPPAGGDPPSGGPIVAVPLAADLPGSGPEGRVDGLLAVKADPTRPLTEEDQRLLVGVASHLAVAISNERLVEWERNRLRSYAMLMTHAQEEERKRIARELHDEAAQNVVVIQRGLAALAAGLDGPGPGELSDLAGQTVAGMRRFSRDLRPPTLDELGLSSALDQLIAQARERSGLEAELHVSGRARRLPIETELAVFRIGQAALHNVELHASARSAMMELRFETNQVHLEITDDGSGFDPPRNLAELPTAGKLGLLGMHERAQLVGGRLQIRSRPGEGTRVLLDVPS